MTAIAAAAAAGAKNNAQNSQPFHVGVAKRQTI